MLNWKKVIKSNEFIVAVMIVFLSIVIGLKIRHFSQLETYLESCAALL